jgi:Flp pilus assembly protein TadG
MQQFIYHNCKHPKRLALRRRGAAAVEFAVVAPIFFLFIFGMIEYGRMVMVQQVLTNAAREGARVAILDNSTSTGVTNAANSYLTPANINASTISVSPDPPSSADSGAPVSVTVSVRSAGCPAHFMRSGICTNGCSRQPATHRRQEARLTPADSWRERGFLAQLAKLGEARSTREPASIGDHM